jgi:alpha-D-ribose 1-methylphosphonate 5-triphosphate synthase subunit PhnH
LTVGGVHPAWLQRRAAWTADFPTGVDLIFCGGGSIAALPRTTGVEWKE